MLFSILTIVALPIILGVIINTWANQRLHRIKPIFPKIGLIALGLTVAAVVALNHDQLIHLGWAIIIAVVLHNLLGLLFGYGIPRLLGVEPPICRTLAIEVAIQNSGLGMFLALKYFTPIAALPNLLFSIWHNISGAMVSAYWRRKDAN